MNKIIIIIIAVAAFALAGAAYWFSRDADEIATNSDALKSNNGPEVTTQNVVYFENTTGYFARPKAEGSYPGIVMIHEWWGLNDNIKNMANELAKEGYAVLAVDLYNGTVAATPEEARTLTGSIKQDKTIDNLRAAAGYLRGQGADQIASLGWCFGGGQSMQLALSGEELDATVIYYGQLVTDQARLAAISWPVLGIFGEKDTSIPTTTVRMFETNLDNASVRNEVYIYPGVGHAFANPSGANYAEDETKDAWAKTLAFLKRSFEQK